MSTSLIDEPLVENYLSCLHEVVNRPVRTLTAFYVTASSPTREEAPSGEGVGSERNL
jgi:hypothetical protein